jgi:hypothetical protein
VGGEFGSVGVLEWGGSLVGLGAGRRAGCL